MGPTHKCGWVRVLRAVHFTLNLPSGKSFARDDKGRGVAQVGVESGNGRNCRSLHYGLPDFLWRVVPLMKSIRLSEQKHSIYARAHDRGRETAGPSTALRSGRDDNSVAGLGCVPVHVLRVSQNCHPDRSEAQRRDLLFLPRPGCFPRPHVGIRQLSRSISRSVNWPSRYS